MKPTSAQQAAIDCEGNAVVTACPGSGKTFTLVRMIARESVDLLSFQGVIALSYTNKASEELRKRCERIGVKKQKSFFGTVDSFCLSQIIIPFAPQITNGPLSLKVAEDNNFNYGQWKELPEECRRDFILKSFEVESIQVDIIGAAALLVLEMVPQARIFIKARYTSIFIDEYQDCDYYQHQLMKTLMSYGLRSVAIGDIDQSIFQYNGSSPNYLRELISSEKYEHFVINENHRCDPSIQEYSRVLIGGTHAKTIPERERRVFAVHISGDEGDVSRTIERFLPRIMKKYQVENRSSVAIIGCRNRTLERVSSALTLPHKRFADTTLKSFSRWQRILSGLLTEYYNPEHFSGDFLDNYLGINVKTTKRNQGLALVDDFFGVREEDLVNQTDLAFAIADLCGPGLGCDEDIEAYCSTVKDVDILRRGFRPAQSDEINVLTYHKAKGLEFDIVFCLEAYRFIMPPYKGVQKDIEQSLGMHYVGITRAKKACYIALGSQRHNKDGLRDAEPSEFLTKNEALKGLRRDVHW